MLPILSSDFMMWMVLLTAFLALVMYVWEKISLELTSIVLIGVLLFLFEVFPPMGQQGIDVNTVNALLLGFSNPALITVLCLLVIGQAMVNTGSISYLADYLFKFSGKNFFIAYGIALLSVMMMSAFLNNTPVVIIFIPVMQALAERSGYSPSFMMIPLSYVAILGGMLTLIGSSTNLLVSNSFVDLGYESLGFFSLFPIALPLVILGVIYLLGVIPFLLPSRASLKAKLTGGEGKQFISQIVVTSNSQLVDQLPFLGFVKYLPNITVQMIVRGEHAELPPFEQDFKIKAGDVLVVAASRDDLMNALSKDSGLSCDKFHVEPKKNISELKNSQVLVEAMITPGSFLEGQTLEFSRFRQYSKCLVVGIQRRSRMLRSKITEIQLKVGDVLLIQGHPDDIESLRQSRNLVLLEWSTKNLKRTSKALKAVCIFLGVVLLASFNVLSILVAAFWGALFMLLTRVMTLRQAMEALDYKIVFLIVASLSLGRALEMTGGIEFIVSYLMTFFQDASLVTVLSSLFILVAFFTNLLSNMACAVLFTPIAVGLAEQLQADPMLFVMTVILSANCSFASPVAYQTNLLVLGPGHYRFSDYMKAGLPLILLLWAAFTLMIFLKEGIF